MDASIHPASLHSGSIHPTSIHLDGRAVTIERLRTDDPVVAAVLARHDENDRGDLAGRMLAVGARGLESMGMGLDLADVDKRVRATVDEALTAGRGQLTAMLTDLQKAIGEEFDPERRASVVARVVADLERFRADMAAAVDPARNDSHSAALLSEMSAMLGAGGLLESRLRSALDPANDGSALAGALARIERGLAALQTAVSEQRGRSQAEARGTGKGFDYEDRVEDRLREWARPLGAVVERTSTAAGNRGPGLVGDFVVELPDGLRVVVEAKHCASLPLNGSTGILAELDRARDNRDAQVAVCLSHGPAFPREVGPFGVYGDAVLAVDDLDGTMLVVAMTWAVQHGRHRRNSGLAIDRALVDDRIGRIRSLVGQISASRRALTEIVGSVEKVRNSLDRLRLDLLDATADVGHALRSGPAGEVVPIRRSVADSPQSVG